MDDELEAVVVGRKEVEEVEVPGDLSTIRLDPGSGKDGDGDGVGTSTKVPASGGGVDVGGIVVGDSHLERVPRGEMSSGQWTRI